MKEPQIGIEPMTARLAKAADGRLPSEKQCNHIVLRVQRSLGSVQSRRTNGNEMAMARQSFKSRAKPTEGAALMDRIRERVAFSPSGCWIWQGTKNSQGYGQIKIRPGDQTVPRSRSVHRLVAAESYGAIPDGMMALHTCDVRACVNPAHLYLGTALDNARDCKERGRSVNTLTIRNASKTHCPQRHPYDAENTIVRKKGDRLCRICVAVQSRRRSAARAASKQQEAAA